MKKLVLIQLLLFSIIAFGQPPTRFYSKFGGNGVDVGYSGKPTLDRQYIVAGSTSSYGAGNTDLYLVKVDSMGYPLWEKTFGGFNNDVGKSVIQLADSGYVVAGFTNSFGAGGYDVYLVRTDKNGNLIWQKTFGGLDWDFANDLVLSPDGDIVVVGYTSSFGAGDKDGLIIKYDYSGNLVQQKYIGGIGNEELRSVIVTTDFLLAAVGYTESRGDVNGDCLFAKLNLVGDTIFTRYFGGSGKDYLNDILQKPNTNFVFCGAKTYSTNPKTESLAYSMDANGTFLWENHFSDTPTGDEEFVSLCNTTLDYGHTVYLRNRSKAPFKMQQSIIVALPFGIYYSADEEGGIEDEFCYSIESTSDGGTISVGITNSYGSINGDVYFLKQDSSLKNNSNIVSVNEHGMSNIKPILKYSSNHEIIIDLDNSYTIYKYRITSIDGSVCSDNVINSSGLKIDLDRLPKTILILEIEIDNGNFYYYKITNP